MNYRPFDNSRRDWQILHDICYGCGSENVKKSHAYIRTAQWQGGKHFFCDIFEDGAAFFAGSRGQDHIRVVDLAVLLTRQHQGLGTQIMMFEIAKARSWGIRKMTLRTAMNEHGRNFWASLGGKITGRRGEDWEMELRF